MFDVPRKTQSVVEWHGELPIEDFDWSVGLIVGPSGSGKSSILENHFGKVKELHWGAASVIDDFAKSKSMVDISQVCRAVGFNTIPSWLRPYAVLSNGERFRVDLARRLIECEGDIVVDEFTSVVDRQVGQIASHAVQKYVRKQKRRFVAASCHYDIVDWLQPDWIFEPTTMTFQRRALQRRPELQITICRVPYSTWNIFAPYHYMSADLNKAARCFALFVNDRLAAFSAILHLPISRGKSNQPMFRISRVVTLPDWQGLGLAPLLDDTLGGVYKALGYRLRAYPAHPSFIAVRSKSQSWQLVKAPGVFKARNQSGMTGMMGGRPCAIFEYIGPAAARKIAEQLLC